MTTSRSKGTAAKPEPKPDVTESEEKNTPEAETPEKGAGDVESPITGAIALSDWNDDDFYALRDAVRDEAARRLPDAEIVDESDSATGVPDLDMLTYAELRKLRDEVVSVLAVVLTEFERRPQPSPEEGLI